MCFMLLLGRVICTCPFNLYVEISYYSCATISVFLSLNFLLHFSDISNIRCIYIFYLVQLFGKLTILSLYNIYLIALFFSSVYFVWYTVSPAFFRMDFFHPLTVHLSMSLGLWVLPVSTLWQTLYLLPCVFPPVTSSSGPCACASYGGERQAPWTAPFMPL